MHLLAGFIGDPAGQLNALANPGELTTARALQAILKHHNIILLQLMTNLSNFE